jgi:hypothetical protein
MFFVKRQTRENLKHKWQNINTLTKLQTDEKNNFLRPCYYCFSP